MNALKHCREFSNDCTYDEYSSDYGIIATTLERVILSLSLSCFLCFLLFLTPHARILVDSTGAEWPVGVVEPPADSERGF